jgi:type II secretory pathway pseudopilin PulG
MPRTAASASGFTLIEMLLVVTLAIMAAAIALPNLRTMNDTYRLSTASAAVASKVRQARVNALKRNRQTWVTVDGAARSVQVQTAGAGGPVDIDGPALMPTGVVFGTGAATVTLTFDAMGRPLAAPQTIQLLYPGSGLTRTITVTSTGRVTVN